MSGEASGGREWGAPGGTAPGGLGRRAGWHLPHLGAAGASGAAQGPGGRGGGGGLVVL